MSNFVTNLWHKTWFYKKYIEINQNIQNMKRRILISIIVLITIFVLFKMYKVWMLSRKSS